MSQQFSVPRYDLATLEEDACSSVRMDLSPSDFHNDANGLKQLCIRYLLDEEVEPDFRTELILVEPRKGQDIDVAKAEVKTGALLAIANVYPELERMAYSTIRFIEKDLLALLSCKGMRLIPTI